MNWLSWPLLSAFFAGLTAILAKIGVEGVNSNLATALRTTVVLVFTWLIAFATSPVSSVREISNRTWLYLTLSRIATGLSWLCYFRALQLGPDSRVAPIDKLSVVFALIPRSRDSERAAALAAICRRSVDRDRRLAWT
jgi:bacterial/archaeal transporter family protein